MTRPIGIGVAADGATEAERAILAGAWGLIGEAFVPREAAGVLPLPEYAGTLVVPDGRVRGELYDPRSHQAQWCLIQEIARRRPDGTRRWRRVSVLKPAQDGGTLVAFVALLHAVVACRRAAILAYPTDRLVRRAWVKKLRPLIHAQRGVVLDGAGERGGVPVAPVEFPGGGSLTLVQAGGRGESAQASDTVDEVYLDELDDWPSSDAVRRLDSRQTESSDPFTMEWSTVKHDQEDASLVLASVDSPDASGSSLVYRCPVCRRYAGISPDQIAADGDDAETIRATAACSCAACGVRWDEDQRQEALADWRLLHRGQRVIHCVGDDGAVEDARVVGPPPMTDWFSLRWWLGESPRHLPSEIVLARVAAEQALARGDEAPMRTYRRDVECRLWKAPSRQGIEVAPAALARKSAASDHPPARHYRDESRMTWTGVVPDGTEYLTAHVDQQLRRLEWMAVAHLAGARRAIVAWGVESFAGDKVQPTEDDRHAGLDRVNALIKDGFPEGGGRIRVPVIAGLDVATFTRESLTWLQWQPDWIAVRGAGEEIVQRMAAKAGRGGDAREAVLGRPTGGQRLWQAPGWCELRQQQHDGDGSRWDLLWVESDLVKRELAQALAQPHGHPGGLDLPRGLSAEDGIVRQLCSERLELASTGRWLWVKHGKYNEAWDCAYVNLALGAYWSGRFGGGDPALAEREASATGGDQSWGSRILPARPGGNWVQMG